MTRPDTPRVAYYLFGAGLTLILLAGLALATGQPMGVMSLGLGLGLGLNIATVVMIGEVRKERSPK